MCVVEIFNEPDQSINAMHVMVRHNNDFAQLQHQSNTSLFSVVFLNFSLFVDHKIVQDCTTFQIAYIYMEYVLDKVITVQLTVLPQ